MSVSQARSVAGMRDRHRRWWTQAVNWLLSVAVAYLLLSSALAHINNPYQYLYAIYSYQLVPRLVAEAAAAMLPFLHGALAICLIGGVAQRQALSLAFMLFLSYAILQVVTRARGLNIACGCFGPSETPNPIGAWSIGIAVASAAGCLLGWWFTGASGRGAGQGEVAAPVGVES